MRIYTLSASEVLGKTITKTDTGYETAPYPFVKNFTSHEFDVNTIEDFYHVIKTAGEAGHTLLKGQLKRTLTHESRAGSTDPLTLTSWLCFDIDTNDYLGMEPDQILEQIDPNFKNVSYIIQYSARDGITSKKGVRYHIFVMLSASYLPAKLKQWMISINLNNDVFRDKLELNAIGSALKYPLDVSVNQNDKLIYIAPPTCIGFEDPLEGQRVELIKREIDMAQPTNINVNPQQNQFETDNTVNELRERNGLGKKNFKTKQVGSLNIIINPDAADVTDVKIDRGFVYMNLNGGDSWAYYCAVDNPEILYNFKGENPVYLRTLAPEIYAQLTQHKRETALERVFALRDLKTDCYYNGTFLPRENKVHIYSVASKEKIKDFLTQHGEPNPEFIEDWDVSFNPTTNEVFNHETKFVNTFSPTKYMLDDDTPCPSKLPRTIDRILRSICGDDVTLNHFLNWLAFSFQYRTKPGTAWIFHGVQGTGKGILHERILMPLFGEDHVPKITTSMLEEKFNGYAEKALILVIDEVNLDSRDANSANDKLKNLITEDHISIRNMRSNAYMAKTYFAIILNSNHNIPVTLPKEDRRMNVAPAQETPLQISFEEIELIEDELPLFSAFLRDYKVDRKKVHKPLLNEARLKMIRASETTIETFFNAVKTGDLDYFLEYLNTKNPMQMGDKYLPFELIVLGWIKTLAVSNEKIFVTRDDLNTVYNFLQNNNTSSATKFSRMCSTNRVELTKHRIDGKLYKGLWVEFKQGDSTDLTGYLTDNKRKTNVLELGELH